MSGERRVLRYEVPVDDEWHRIESPGRILSRIAARRPDVVEFWAIQGGAVDGTGEFRVYGTGQPIEAGDVSYIGTTLAADGALVWHLFKREVA
jgi:hypothetical protein